PAAGVAHLRELRAAQDVQPLALPSRARHARAGRGARGDRQALCGPRPASRALPLSPRRAFRRRRRLLLRHRAVVAVWRRFSRAAHAPEGIHGARRSASERSGSAARGRSGARRMSSSLAWALLVLSGLLDVAWAVSMKYAAGYTRPGWSALSIALLAAFVYLLGKTL